MNTGTEPNINLVRFLATHRPFAAARLQGSEAYPNIWGQLFFYPLNDRYTVVVSQFEGLPTVEACESPFFALHIHNGTACAGDAEDSFRESGTHYNPENCPHPAHAGDLPPVLATGNSRSWSAVLTDRFSVGEVMGKPVILHRQPDDFKTQPSGNAGEKIACGLITRFMR